MTESNRKTNNSKIYMFRSIKIFVLILFLSCNKYNAPSDKIKLKCSEGNINKLYDTVSQISKTIFYTKKWEIGKVFVNTSAKGYIVDFVIGGKSKKEGVTIYLDSNCIIREIIKNLEGWD